MDQRTISSLRPTGQSSGDIEAALARIAQARVTAFNVAAGATAKLDANALTLTSKERRELTDTAEDAALDVRQLDGMASEMRAALEQAQSRGRMAASEIARKALSARLVEHQARFEAEYPALHEALARLMTERRALFDDIEKHNMGGLNEVDASGLKDALSEVRLLKTDEQRAYDAVPYSMRILLNEKAARETALSRGPRVVNQAIPAPTVMVEGALVDVRRFG
jgi:hypothetical protein